MERNGNTENIILNKTKFQNTLKCTFTILGGFIRERIECYE